MFLIRPTVPDDLDAIFELAVFLDSPNLPTDREFLATRLERSTRAFGQPGPASAEREYQFALVNEADQVVGTCAILSKHGTPGMPHMFLRVGEEVRHSETVVCTMRHKMLQLGSTTDGPTELGALVLHPKERGRGGRPGTLLSWGRFAYIARHRSCFEDRVLAEMRASLDAWGRSAFWDAFGRHFTGMSYADADRLSATDKSFILDLFPDVPFYASLLDAEVAAQLGQVHEETRPALSLLERAGIEPIDEIDPFDGGPFVGANTDDVIPINSTLFGTLIDNEPGDAASDAIVMTEEGGHLRGVIAKAESCTGGLRLAKDAWERLEISPGDELTLTPLPPKRKRGESHG
ncbi:MAG: arginine N-succinyltransferase [bacterium]|nr:arginine N-succinyltransferase [bacterium]